MTSEDPPVSAEETWDVERIRERLLQSANRIMAEHWPGDDGCCPICGSSGCWAMRQATSYLEEVLDYRTTLAPPPMSVEILIRTAVPPPGVHLDHRLASDEHIAKPVADGR